MKIKMFPSILITLLVGIASLTHGLPHNYPVTVGFARLNFLPSPIQNSGAPLGYHSNSFVYPPHQNIYIWTPAVIGQANPDENKIVQDDTVAIVNPDEEEKVKSEGGSGDDEPAREVLPPPEDGEPMLVSDENPKTPEEEGAAKPVEGQVYIPVQIPSPPHVALVPVTFVPHYPGFVQLLPADNKATIPAPGEQPIAPEEASQDDTKKDDAVVLEGGEEAKTSDDALAAADADAFAALGQLGEDSEPAAAASDDDTVRIENPEEEKVAHDEESVNHGRPGLDAEIAKEPEIVKDEPAISAGDDDVQGEPVKVEEHGDDAIGSSSLHADERDDILAQLDSLDKE